MRLELTRRGDYGVRAMLVLAREQGRVVSGNEIAVATGISGHFVTQVMGDLVRAGLVDARVGRAGGYRLAKAPSEISVLSVVESIEGEARRRNCVLRATPCTWHGRCEVHEFFAAAQEAFAAKLREASLTDALQEPQS